MRSSFQDSKSPLFPFKQRQCSFACVIHVPFYIQIQQNRVPMWFVLFPKTHAGSCSRSHRLLQVEGFRACYCAVLTHSFNTGSKNVPPQVILFWCCILPSTARQISRNSSASSLPSTGQQEISNQVNIAAKPSRLLSFDLPQYASDCVCKGIISTAAFKGSKILLFSNIILKPPPTALSGASLLLRLR